MKIGTRVGTDYNSFLVLIFFVAVLLINLSNIAITKVFYYSILLCISFSFILANKKLPFLLFSVILGILLLGSANSILVGNVTLPKLFIIISSFPVGYIFLKDNVNEKSALIAVYLNSIIVLCFFVLYGIEQPIYDSSSNNYVSVQLLAPTVVYYTLREKNKKSIPFFPILLVLVICTLAGGRGGMISVLVLFSGLVFLRWFNTNRKLFVILCLLAFVPVLVSIMPSITNRLSFKAINQLETRALNDNGRFVIWYEYTDKSLGNWDNFIFGTELDSIDAAIRYEGNLHNSFLFIHAYLGVLGFLLVICWLLRCFIYSIKNRKWVYFLCLTSFLIRGMTDHVFGADRWSPIFVFLLLYPLLSDNTNKLFITSHFNKYIVYKAAERKVSL